MKLSLSQKETFYRELEQFMRSGIPLPQAVEALVPETGGGVRRVLKALLALLLKGQSIGDSFGALQPTFGTLEISIIQASANTGRLDQAFTYLSNYFGALEMLRAGVVRRTIWPVVQLHFGVFVINIGSYFLGGLTAEGYLLRCFGTLAVFYAAGLLAWALIAFLMRVARVNPVLDRALGMIPLLGKLRRYLALSRFCATYEMQLQAAINVVDAVRAASAASQRSRGSFRNCAAATRSARSSTAKARSRPLCNDPSVLARRAAAWTRTSHGGRGTIRSPRWTPWRRWAVGSQGSSMR